MIHFKFSNSIKSIKENQRTRAKSLKRVQAAYGNWKSVRMSMIPDTNLRNLFMVHRILTLKLQNMIFVRKN